MAQRKEIATRVNTFLLIPNIIEYIRLSLLFLIFFYAFNAPVFTALYLICAHLDAFDGYAARRLKQESSLGTILDYMVDRISIALLSSILIVLYPERWYFFAAVLMLDIGSHFCQLYATVFFKIKSHKVLGNQQGKILHVYYTNKLFCYSACIAHELWLGSFYLHYYYPHSYFVYGLMIFLFPGFILKIVIHILQIITSLSLVAEI